MWKGPKKIGSIRQRHMVIKYTADMGMHIDATSKVSS